MESKAALRILFQSTSRLKDGQLTRLQSIAKELNLAVPSVATAFVIEGLDDGITNDSNNEVISIPSVHRLAVGWPWLSQVDRIDLATAISGEILRYISPRLVVFDSIPAPAFLLACLDVKLPFILCLSSATAFEDYSEDPYVQVALRKACLLLHTEEEQDFSKFPVSLHSRLRHVGPVVAPLPENPMPVALDLNAMGEIVIVIFGGREQGLEDMAFFRKALAAVAVVLKSEVAARVLVICGKLFSRVMELESSGQVKYIAWHPKLIDVFATADLVVLGGADDSLAELAPLGTATICLLHGRHKNRSHVRVKWYSSHFAHIHQASMSEPVAVLAELIVECMKTRVRRQDSTGFQGARKAAQLINNLIG